VIFRDYCDICSVVQWLWFFYWEKVKIVWNRIRIFVSSQSRWSERVFNVNRHFCSNGLSKKQCRIVSPIAIHSISHRTLVFFWTGSRWYFLVRFVSTNKIIVASNGHDMSVTVDSRWGGYRRRHQSYAWLGCETSRGVYL